MFRKESWCDFIKTTVEYDNAFKCYLDTVGPCSYAMNEGIPADANELPGDLVVLFESGPGWNTVGGADDVVTDRAQKTGSDYRLCGWACGICAGGRHTEVALDD